MRCLPEFLCAFQNRGIHRPLVRRVNNRAEQLADGFSLDSNRSLHCRYACPRASLEGVLGRGRDQRVFIC
eukprot:13791964-Alexandrium_andersonii.AAC.1